MSAQKKNYILSSRHFWLASDIKQLIMIQDEVVVQSSPVVPPSPVGLLPDIPDITVIGLSGPNSDPDALPLYQGSIRDLQIFINSDLFNRTGFGFDKIKESDNLIMPKWIFGTKSVDTLAEMINLIEDWSNPVVTVIFVPWTNYDRNRISYQKWYEYNNLALVAYGSTYYYVERKNLPSDWFIIKETGVWVSPYWLTEV